MIAALKEAARATWPTLAPGRPAPQHIHCMKVGWLAYPAPESALVFFLFADADAAPFAVAKAARVPSGDALVRAEIAALSTLPAHLSNALARLCPTCVASGTWNDRAWMLMTMLPGEVEMHHTWGIPPRPPTFPRLDAALDVAQQLRRQQAAAPLQTSEFLERSNPAQVVREIAAGWQDAERAALHEMLEKHWEHVWPAGPAHGDFFPGNILFDGARVAGVVDWSFASERQPVFTDVLQYEVSFLLHAALGGRVPTLAARQQLRAAAPLARAHAQLAADGVDSCGPGSVARCVFMSAGAIRRTGIWAARAQTADLFAALLRAEVGNGAGAPHEPARA